MDPLTHIEKQEGELTTTVREASRLLVEDLMELNILKPFSRRKRRLLVARALSQHGLRETLEVDLEALITGRYPQDDDYEEED